MQDELGVGRLHSGTEEVAVAFGLEKASPARDFHTTPFWASTTGAVGI